jgi:hypothetical protein
MIKRTAAALLPLLALGFAGCMTTDATTLPFDLASTTGDAGSSASSSTDGEDESASLRTRHYVRTQLDWIEREAAGGEGEHIEALAVLLGETDPAAFASWAQRHHGQLFSDLREPEELIARIDAAR